MQNGDHAKAPVNEAAESLWAVADTSDPISYFRLLRWRAVGLWINSKLTVKPYPYQPNKIKQSAHMKFLLVATIPLRSQCQNGDRQYNNNTLVIIEKLLLYFISHPPFILYYNKRRMRTVKFLDLCLRLWYQHSGLSHMMWREYPMQCSSSVK